MFFHNTRMPADRSFWHHVLDKQGLLDRIHVDSECFHRTWRPERSNCPELTSTLEDMISSVPGEWIARARNIFVGRVMGGEVNATAWSHRQAGIVEIDLQFTYAVDGYVTAFDEYVSATRGVINDALTGPLDRADIVVRRLDERFGRPWDHLNESYNGWLDPRIVVSWNVELLKTARSRRDVLDNSVDACEEFVMAHELGHHLLGHTNSSLPKNIRADKLVQRALAHPALFGIVRRLNSAQRQEAHADILAFLIVARAVDRTPSFPELYRAIVGSSLALTALAHLNGTWVETDFEATHPGSIDRFVIVQCLTEQLSAGRGLGEVGDHPLDLLAQLKVFTSIALNDWLAKRWPEKSHPPNLLQAVDWYLDERESAMSRIPIDKDV